MNNISKVNSISNSNIDNNMNKMRRCLLHISFIFFKANILKGSADKVNVHELKINFTKFSEEANGGT